MTQNTFLYYVGLIYSRDRNKSIHVRVLPAMFQMIFGSGKTPHVNEYITVTRINQTLTLKRILCHGHGRRGLLVFPLPLAQQKACRGWATKHNENKLR